MQVTEILRMEHVNRTISGKRLLRDASINVRQGEIVGLLGLNDSGKSLLMQIACGSSPYDSGNIFFCENKIEQYSAEQAIFQGIHYLHSFKSLSHSFSIMENIFYLRSSKQLIIHNKNEHYNKTKKLLKMLQLNHSPNKLVSKLDLYEKLLVLIAKAIQQNAILLVIDNILPQLPSPRLKQLANILHILSNHKISIILVDHTLEYLISCCNRIFVMREKTTVGEFERSTFNEQKLMSVLIGRDYLPSKNPYASLCNSDCVFESQNIKKAPLISNLSFRAKSGEIVGLCTKSIEEASAITDIMFGKTIVDSGNFFVCKQPFTVKRESDMIKMGVGVISESNETFENLSLYENIMLIANQKYVKMKLFVDNKQLLQNFNDLYYLNFYNTIFLSKHKQCKNLDKLTQKQICIFRHLILQPKVLFLNNPFLNFDVLSSEKLMRLFVQLSENGMAIIIQSPNINNLLAICNKILFIDKGATAQEMPVCSEFYQDIIDFSKIYYL